jgi:hypothetical protein
MTEGVETRGKARLHMLQLLTMVSHLQSYVVMVPGPAGYCATHLVYNVSSIVGWLAGYKPWCEEYTPPRLHAGAAAGAGKSKLT